MIRQMVWPWRRWLVTFIDMDDQTKVLGRERAFTRTGAQQKALLRRPSFFARAEVTRRTEVA